ncbi:hypothetical protein [Devosia sp. SL43]|uniref:hypothetical protein n=1 Tax=Devosia sp. SL43 TaxID=2806348 RepID=UPI001F258520|nr:hypothetical protein [Devosia sp. SL43]UJW87955.1 phage tail tape measure protein [Devosia sp. SL43]
MVDQVTATKVCSKCGVEKPVDDAHFGFYTDKGVRRRMARCKVCINASNRMSREANPERHKEYNRRNCERNKPAGSDYQKRRYALKDKAKAAEDLKRWRSENPDKMHEHWKRTYEKHKEKHSARVKNWQRKKRAESPEFQQKHTEANRQYRQANPEKMREYYRLKSAERRRKKAGDLDFRMMASIRARIRNALKGSSKSVRTAELLGASLDVVRSHIEKQFTDGMTWENWGRGWGGRREWHMDHVKPLVSFDVSDPKQLAEACHYTNLQPLWAFDNLKKGGRFDPA